MCVPEGNVVSGGGDCINGRSQFQPTAENRRNLFLFFLFLFDSPVCVCRRDCLMALFNLFFARSFSLVVGVVHTHTHTMLTHINTCLGKYTSGTLPYSLFLIRKSGCLCPYLFLFIFLNANGIRKIDET